MLNLAKRLGILALTLGLCACAVVSSSGERTSLSRNARWAVLPVLNHTETPQAGLRAETILIPLLHQRGISKLVTYPASLNRDNMLTSNEQATQEEAKRWARGQGFRYAVSGSVDEWRYKVGVDGEPAVGMNLMVWDLTADQIIWSSVGSKSGFSRDSVSGVAQQLLQQLTNRLPLSD